MSIITVELVGQLSFSIGNVTLDIHVYYDSDKGVRYTFIDVEVDGHVYRKLTIAESDEAETPEVFDWEDVNDAS